MMSCDPTFGFRSTGSPYKGFEHSYSAPFGDCGIPRVDTDPVVQLYMEKVASQARLGKWHGAQARKKVSSGEGA